MKKWYQSKTVWFNILGLVIAIAGELSSMFPAGNVAKIAGIVITIGNVLLRFVTTTTISK